MLYQIVSFLLDVATGLLCGASLLRVWMQWQRIPFANPVGRLVFALSDGMVLPLRRVIGSLGGADGASLTAAYLTGLVGLLIVYAVMSWVQARSPVSDVIARLCEPVLRPVRRIVPLVGGVDLSPLLVLVLLQVALMVLGSLQASLLFRG